MGAARELEFPPNRFRKDAVERFADLVEIAGQDPGGPAGPPVGPTALPESFDHTRSYAARAAATARSTSAAEASLTCARVSAVAGLIVGKEPPVPAWNSPSMNRP